MRDRLKYLQPSIDSLIAQAASSMEFSSLKFLMLCREKMSNGIGFAEAWRKSVNSDNTDICKDTTEIIVNLSETLGRCDLDSQLAALEYGIVILESRLQDAREYAAKHKKLYRALGVLSGLAIAILIA